MMGGASTTHEDLKNEENSMSGCTDNCTFTSEATESGVGFSRKVHPFFLPKSKKTPTVSMIDISKETTALELQSNLVTSSTIPLSVCNNPIERETPEETFDNNMHTESIQNASLSNKDTNTKDCLMSTHSFFLSATQRKEKKRLCEEAQLLKERKESDELSARFLSAVNGNRRKILAPREAPGACWPSHDYCHVEYVPAQPKKSWIGRTRHQSTKESLSCGLRSMMLEFFERSFNKDPVEMKQEQIAFYDELELHGIQFIDNAEVASTSFSQIYKYLQNKYGSNALDCFSCKALLKRLEMSFNQQDGPLSELWTEKYRPLRSKYLLGSNNRMAAEEVKSWLHSWSKSEADHMTHSIPSKRRKDASKKTRRKRTFDKDRSYKDMTDFIVSDDDECDEIDLFEESDDDFEVAKPTKKRVKRKPDADSAKYLMLTGPPGSGKSALVYALAEECGYEILELNSSNKRSGKDVTSFLMEATQSHRFRRVLNDGHPIEPKSPSHVFVGNPKTPEKMIKSTASLGVLSNLSDAGLNEAANDSSSNSNYTTPKKPRKLGLLDPCSPMILQQIDPKNVKKTLILIEEADILFEADRGFWTGVLSLLEKSRRPIIFTSEVNPFHPSNLCFSSGQLEQLTKSIKIVPIYSPPAHELQLYLQLLLLNEGVLANPQFLQDFCHTERCFSDLRGFSGNISQIDHLLGVEQVHMTNIDIRRKIMRLQGLFGTIPGESNKGKGAVKTFRVYSDMAQHFNSYNNSLNDPIEQLFSSIKVKEVQSNVECLEAMDLLSQFSASLSDFDTIYGLDDWESYNIASPDDYIPNVSDLCTFSLLRKPPPSIYGFGFDYSVGGPELCFPNYLGGKEYAVKLFKWLVYRSIENTSPRMSTTFRHEERNIQTEESRKRLQNIEQLYPKLRQIFTAHLAPFSMIHHHQDYHMDYAPYLKHMIEYDSEQWRSLRSKQLEEEGNFESTRSRRSTRLKCKSITPHFPDFKIPHAIIEEYRNIL